MSEPVTDPWQKVAVLMVSLGQDLAAELLRQFADADVEQITRALAEIKHVSPEAREAVLAEFETELSAGRLPLMGGAGFARGLLEHALGAERAAQIWDRLHAPASAFRFLEQADPEQVAPAVGREHPQTIALILSQLSPRPSAALLERLPSAVQVDVAHRIATLERVSPEILQEVEAGLAEVLEPMLSGQQRVGGAQKAADILDRAGTRLEKSLMAHLESRDPEIAEQIRDRLFTFDDIARLGAPQIRILLENVEPGELLVACKAAGKGVLDAILSAVSERRRARMLEDLADLPKTRLSEVEAAQSRVVQRLRQLEGEGLVDLSRPDGDEAWV